MTSNINHLMTVADLDAFPDDGNHYELIDGELFISYSHDIPHQLIRSNVSVAIGLYLQQNPIGIVVPEVGVVFSYHDAVIPDVNFVSAERWDSIVENDRFSAAPDLIVEIVSPGDENRDRDLKAKRALYGNYRVKEYWIVDQEDRSVTIFYLSGKILAQNRVARDGDEITSPLLPGFTVQVSSIFKLAPWQ